MKKVGKTTRPFRYDLNQIAYDYTVKVRNRFKGLDLIDRVPDELWMEVHEIVQEIGIKTISKKKKRKKAKWLSGKALQIVVKRREAKSKGEKERPFLIKEKVRCQYGDIPLGSQNRQPWRRPLGSGGCGLHELFQDPK